MNYFIVLISRPSRQQKNNLNHENVLENPYCHCVIHMLLLTTVMKGNLRLVCVQMMQLSQNGFPTGDDSDFSLCLTIILWFFDL